MTNDHIRRNENVRFYHVQKSKKGVRKRLSSAGADLKSKIERIMLTTNPARRPGERTGKTKTERSVM